MFSRQFLSFFWRGEAKFVANFKEEESVTISVNVTILSRTADNRILAACCHLGRTHVKSAASIMRRKNGKEHPIPVW
jgi:hypothetical protein